MIPVVRLYQLFPGLVEWGMAKAMGSVRVSLIPDFSASDLVTLEAGFFSTLPRRRCIVGSRWRILPLEYGLISCLFVSYFPSVLCRSNAPAVRCALLIHRSSHLFLFPT